MSASSLARVFRARFQHLIMFSMLRQHWAVIQSWASYSRATCASAHDVSERTEMQVIVTL